MLEELTYWYKRFGIREIAFYDDALLFQADTHLLPILAELCRLGLPLRFHTPNAIHVGLISPEWPNGCSRPISHPSTGSGDYRTDRLDQKIKGGDLEQAMSALHEAGFKSADIGVYLLIGLPHQQDEEIIESILPGAPLRRDPGADAIFADPGQRYGVRRLKFRATIWKRNLCITITRYSPAGRNFPGNATPGSRIWPPVEIK